MTHGAGSPAATSNLPRSRRHPGRLLPEPAQAAHPETAYRPVQSSVLSVAYRRGPVMADFHENALPLSAAPSPKPQV